MNPHTPQENTTTQNAEQQQQTATRREDYLNVPFSMQYVVCAVIVSLFDEGKGAMALVPREIGKRPWTLITAGFMVDGWLGGMVDAVFIVVMAGYVQREMRWSDGMAARFMMVSLVGGYTIVLLTTWVGSILGLRILSQMLWFGTTPLMASLFVMCKAVMPSARLLPFYYFAISLFFFIITPAMEVDKRPAGIEPPDLPIFHGPDLLPVISGGVVALYHLRTTHAHETTLASFLPEGVGQAGSPPSPLLPVSSPYSSEDTLAARQLGLSSALSRLRNSIHGDQQQNEPGDNGGV